jgi:integrase
MAALKQRHHKWEARVRIPKVLITNYGGKQLLYRTLQSNNRRAAEIEAREWENGLKAEWAALVGNDSPALQGIRRDRREYAQVRLLAAKGHYRVEIANQDPALAGIDYEIEKIAERTEGMELSSLDFARLAALNDAASELQGLAVPKRPELEPTFSELATEYMRWWKAQDGLKPSNTEQQKQATFALFAGYWDDKHLRRVRREDAAKFFDALRMMNPLWARSPKARKLPWAELQRQYGGLERGLSDATMNRHLAALQQLWRWAEERGHCVGHNPFTGFRRRLKQGVNVRGYAPWEADELNRLFDPLPKRSDLVEVMLVGMFTGMRLNEIASLSGTQVREHEGVNFIQVVDAKTPAGNRQVPLHTRLEWLKERSKEAGEGRIWPNFNPEGPGKKPGADAGREFSRLKVSRGFGDRRKTFHSFRKNVTRIMERARIRENEWAQVFGHEKGFTYGRYNEEGLTLHQKAEIIYHNAYTEVNLPEPRTEPAKG